LFSELGDRLLEALQLGVLALQQLAEEKLRQHEHHEQEDDDHEQRRQRVDEARPDVGMRAQGAPAADHRPVPTLIARS
jgi:hypothetical protein